MTIDLVRNGHVVAPVDLGPGDTFAIHADGLPVAGVLGDQTILSWSTLSQLHIRPPGQRGSVMTAGSRLRPRSARYMARPSVVVPGRWVIHDADTKLCVRARSSIRLFDTEAEADAVTEQMNTALVVCVRCRHKALLAECELKVCERCRRG